MHEQIELTDFFLIAEAVLERPAEQVVRETNIASVESALAAPFASFGGEVFYPDPVERAAIVCSRIIRNHPLIDGNKRVGYECMREMLDRSGVEWPRPSKDAEVIASTVEHLCGPRVERRRLRSLGPPARVCGTSSRVARAGWGRVTGVDATPPRYRSELYHDRALAEGFESELREFRDRKLGHWWVVNVRRPGDREPAFVDE